MYTVKSITNNQILLLGGQHFHPAADLAIGHNLIFIASQHPIYFMLYNFFGLEFS
jgi:hypothetical protein